MINKYDLRQPITWLSLIVAFVACVPLEIFVVIGGGSRRAADWIYSEYGRIHRWANPDLHGEAPKRCRKLFYGRAVVERHVAYIDSLKTMLARAQDDLAAERSSKDA